MSTYSGSTGLSGVLSAAAAMSTFIPVLLWLVQCSHECAEAVVNSVSAVARMVNFMLLRDMEFSAKWQYRKEALVLRRHVTRVLAMKFLLLSNGSVNLSMWYVRIAFMGT